MNNFSYKKILLFSTVLAILAICIFPMTSRHSVFATSNEFLQVEFPAKNRMFMIGEELVYNVSYSIFDLGEVKLQIIDTATKRGSKIYIAKAFIDSYSGVPFVDLHQVFYSELTSAPYSMFFTMQNTAKPDAKQYIQYVFDYKNKKIWYEVGMRPQNVIEKKGEEPVTVFQQDGLSLFYFSRINVRSAKKILAPIFINEKSFMTEFNFTGKIGSQEIDAINYAVETIEFDGQAKFIGIFGMTGYFQGFFSNDSDAVPIVAKMKVLVGSIHIELTKWNRPGWIPPRAKE